VQEIGTTISADGERLPTAVVDVDEHPEVADLARVHAIEGIGDISTQAICVPTADGHQFLLGIRVKIPVQCTFALSFALPEQRQVLDDVAATGQLVIATTDPALATADQPLWLAINVDPAQLLTMLP